MPHQIPHRVRVSVNLRLQPLQQSHLSHQQAPSQLSQSHQRCWGLLCASCATLTTMKFGLKNDLAPNYPNNLHCNLSRPETEIILGQHRAEKAEEKGTSCGAGLLKRCSCPQTNFRGLSLPRHCCNLPAPPWSSADCPPHLDNVSL